MTIVLGDTAADLHASEDSRVNDDHFTRQTLRYEGLRQAVDLAKHQTCSSTLHSQTQKTSSHNSFRSAPRISPIASLLLYVVIIRYTYILLLLWPLLRNTAGFGD